jgi:hypothetical protein
MATSGLGAIHLLNGIYDATLDHAPVLAIVGQSARLPDRAILLAHSGSATNWWRATCARRCARPSPTRLAQSSRTWRGRPAARQAHASQTRTSRVKVLDPVHRERRRRCRRRLARGKRHGG